MEESELKQMLLEGKKSALQVLNSPTISNAPPEKLTSLRVSFDEKFDHVSELLYQNNYFASEKSCEDLLKTLHDKINDRVQSNDYQDFKQLNEDWDLLMKFYRENANGPAKSEISERLCLSKYYREDVE